MEEIHLFSDGSCWKGLGGWGTILRQPSLGTEMELSGYEKETTNNRMELTAVIKGLEALLERCLVEVTSDSQYVVEAFNQGWITRWKANGWYNGSFPLKNKDLWIKIWDLTYLHEVRFAWVRGHNHHPENERCDKLALEARKRLESLVAGGAL
jgi:ribonuclease HI